MSFRGRGRGAPQHNRGSWNNQNQFRGYPGGNQARGPMNTPSTQKAPPPNNRPAIDVSSQQQKHSPQVEQKNSPQAHITPQRNPNTPQHQIADSPQKQKTGPQSSQKEVNTCQQKVSTTAPQKAAQQQPTAPPSGTGKNNFEQNGSGKNESGLPQRDTNRGKAPSVLAPKDNVDAQNNDRNPRGSNPLQHVDQNNGPQQQQQLHIQQQQQGQQRGSQQQQHQQVQQRGSQQQQQQQVQQRGSQQQQLNRGPPQNLVKGGPPPQKGVAQQFNQTHTKNEPQAGRGVQQDSSDPDATNTKLFIATIKQGTTDKEFKDLFVKFGNVKECYLNKNKWFGLVTFDTHDEADAARKHYERSNLLKLKWAQMSPKETPLILNQNEQTSAPKKESSSKCRLFVGNLPSDISEDHFRSLFSSHGSILELYLPQGKGFGFVRFESRAQAEAARASLDGQPLSNRQMQIRFASQGACLKVRNLSHFVTNELLQQAFEPFGELERATVFVDERGKSVGEGVLEFAKKPVAMAVLRKAQQECLLLTTSPLPVIIEPMEVKDDEDGFSEKAVNKASPAFLKEREKGPRFAEKGSFEYDFAMKWKDLLMLEKMKKDHLEREVSEEKAKLREEMEVLRYEYEMESIRQRLKSLEGQQENMENKKLLLDKTHRQREEERKKAYKDIMRRQAEILGYTYEEEQEPTGAAVTASSQAAPAAPLLSGNPAVDAAIGGIAPPPPPEASMNKTAQPSAMAENFMKQWNTLTKGPDAPPNDMPQSQDKKWISPRLDGNVQQKATLTSNMPAYVSYLGQANGKRTSDPGPANKRRRF